MVGKPIQFGRLAIPTSDLERIFFSVGCISFFVSRNIIDFLLLTFSLD